MRDKRREGFRGRGRDRGQKIKERRNEKQERKGEYMER